MVVFQPQPATQAALISPPEQARADREPCSVEKSPLRTDCKTEVPIPLTLDLGTQHSAFILFVIQPVSLPEWPGCTPLAGRIEKALSCCSSKIVEELVFERIGNVLEGFRPQLTIRVETVLRSIRFDPLGRPW